MLQPLAEISIPPQITSLPKADLHIHQEEVARLERVVAQQQDRAAHDWRASARRLLDEIPFGESRLAAMYEPDATLDFGNAQADSPEYIIAKIVDALDEGAADGAILVEIRFGAGSMAVVHPDFMDLFREAERQVQQTYPQLRAEAIGYIGVMGNSEKALDIETQLSRCLALADQGLGGVDFRTHPYDTEASPSIWDHVYRMAERAADAGLGITVHAGEFSAANLAAALKVPHLDRLGHAVYAATDERLLDEIVRRDVTIECSLSCNVVLGAVRSYEEHPIRTFVDAGVKVTLNTDDPVRIGTTIGREYAIAHAMGFSEAELLMFTQHAIEASFAPKNRRAEMLAEA